MNDATLVQLKTVVERAVRPVVAPLVSKRRMRDELLEHLTAVFDEECAALGDEQAALGRAMARFGDPRAIGDELQQSVPRWRRAFGRADEVGWYLNPGRGPNGSNSWIHLAGRHMLFFLGTLACNLALTVPIWWLTRRIDFFTWFKIILVLSAVGSVIFGCLPFAERFYRTVASAAGRKSWVAAIPHVLVAAAVFPLVAFAAYWPLSGDLAAGLRHLRFAACFAPLGPILLLGLGQLVHRERSYREEWSSLEIVD